MAKSDFLENAVKRKFALGQTKSPDSCIVCYITHARLAPQRLGEPSEGCAPSVSERQLPQWGTCRWLAASRIALAATVVAGRGRRVRGPRELLYGGEVGRRERQRCGKANLGPLRVRALAA
jgi:hypothetical protein